VVQAFLAIPRLVYRGEDMEQAPNSEDWRATWPKKMAIVHEAITRPADRYAFFEEVLQQRKITFVWIVPGSADRDCMRTRKVPELAVSDSPASITQRAT
jgi:hypothetical protein